MKPGTIKRLKRRGFRLVKADGIGGSVYRADWMRKDQHMSAICTPDMDVELWAKWLMRENRGRPVSNMPVMTIAGVVNL